MINVLKKEVLDLANACKLFLKLIGVEKIAYLKTDLSILVRIERSDTRFCRAELLVCETLFLVCVEKNVIRHHNLCPVGNKKLGLRNALGSNVVNFLNKLRNIKSYAVTDDVCNLGMAYARRKKMQSKLSVIVDNCVTCVCTALETDNDIRFGSKHICDFTLTFVAPVSADNCSYQ